MSPSAKPQRRGLGRGLASLIPDSAFEAEEAVTRKHELRRIPLEQIRPNPEQPRTAFEPEALQSLADSLKIHGVLTPLVVRREDGRYVLIAGERRLRAAGMAGLHEVPCVVRDVQSPQEQLELALVENLQRDDLDPIEAALGYRRLVEEFGLTQVQVAERVGKQRSTVTNAVRLLGLPDYALDAIRGGTLSAGHGRAVLPLVEQPDVLRALLDRVVDKGLSVREVEREVARVVAGGGPKPVAQTRRDRTLDYATNLLQKALHTSVAIKPRKNGSGRIVLDYADAEDLERLIEHLRGGQA